jgi:peptidylprolyl isomerase
VSRKQTPHKKGYQTTKPGTQQAAAQNQGGLNANAIILGLLVVGVIGVIAYMLWPASTGGSGNFTKTASGLEYEDLTVGTGASPTQGKSVKVHYTGTLLDGTKFDSSVDRGTPFDFVIGTGSVIKGWDEGVMSMKVGGKRRLRIPSALGYGAMGSPPKIPGGATLMFDVELLDAK